MVDRNHFLPRPTGPLMGLWSWRYLNKFKTLKLVTSKRVKAFYSKFPTLYPPGSEFPVLDLETANGARVNTAELRGKKHFVLFTGAIT
ncbi:MAG: hypothetical protein ACE5IM_11915 [Nitrospinota bacterium]